MKLFTILLESMNHICTIDVVPDSNSPIAPVLYYISGWLLTDIEKETLRRGNAIIANYLGILGDDCTCIDSNRAQDAGLPTEKVDGLCAYGGLKYPSAEFFRLISQIKHLFPSVLTNKKLALHMAVSYLKLLPITLKLIILLLNR